MSRRNQILIAGAGAAAGAAAGFFAVKALGRKHINTLPYGYGIKMKKAVTVFSPPARLYSFWRDLTKVSKLFDHVLSIDVLDDSLSHWTLKMPGGIKLEWDAEITVDRKNEMIGWRSLNDADVDNAGYVRFEPATGGRGTVTRVALQYNPPAGKIGVALATVLGERPEGLIEEALRKFKQLMETGEIPKAASEEEELPHSMEPVEAASEDSFPASDPPAWTGTTGTTGPIG
jgi:uncharacterized membrane protein